MKQLSLFPEWEELETLKTRNEVLPDSIRQSLEIKFNPVMEEDLRLGQLVSYAGNKSIPLLRLYRYKEAFSFQLVQEFIKRFNLTEKDYLFDPFCGMGTTLFTAMQHPLSAVGIDKLPIGAFIASTMPLFLFIEPGILPETFAKLKSMVSRAELGEVAGDVSIMQQAFSEEMLLLLRQWKGAITTLESPLKEIFLLLFLAILEPCSYTTKDGQFLRLNKDKQIPNPEEILQQKVKEAEADIITLRTLWKNKKYLPPPSVQIADARDLSTVNFEKQPTAIITSPP